MNAKELKDGRAVRGTLTVRKHRADGSGEVVRIGNELVGPHVLAILCANMPGREEIDRLSVEDTSNASLIALLAVNATDHNGTDAFCTFQWVCPPGTGTGAWDDVYILTQSAEVLSEFIGRNGDLGSKGAGDTWLVTYTLYFVPLSMS
jgi:hypothetical protein